MLTVFSQHCRLERIRKICSGKQNLKMGTAFNNSTPRHRPVASLLLTLLLCSAGSLITDLLLGLNPLPHLLRPGLLIKCLHNLLHSSNIPPPPGKLAAGVSAWVIVSFLPSLLPVISSPPLHNIAVLLKEVYRLRKVDIKIFVKENLIFLDQLKQRPHKPIFSSEFMPKF